MRAVVTGGFGFIGRHLVAQLLYNGDHVTVIDDGRNGTEPLEDRPNLTIRPSAVERVYLIQADVIYHLAAPVGPVGVLSLAGKITQDVIDSSAMVARWALANRAVLINVSTSEVYGSGGADSESDPCSFRAPPSARKEYAVAKLAAETMLANMPGLRVRTIRPFNVAGPGQRSEGGFVLPRFIEQAQRGEPLTVYEPGSQRRSLTHVYDVVDGLVLAAERGVDGELYNLGNPANECSMLDLAIRVLEVMGLSGEARLVDPVALHGPSFREAPDKLPVSDKARRELGWHPTRSLDRIIGDTAGSLRLAA